MKAKRSSESSDYSESCASSAPEIEPIATNHTDVVQATASSTTDAIFVPQVVTPEYYATNSEIHYPSQLTAQPIADPTQYVFPDIQFNARFINSYSSPEGRAFFFDRSVHPTEYYPTGFESNAYNSYPQYGSWLDNYDMSYLN